jgi:hypothetical protein
VPAPDVPAPDVPAPDVPAPDVPAPDVPAVDVGAAAVGRCAGKTLKGEACKRKVCAGSRFCFKHQEPELQAAAASADQQPLLDVDEPYSDLRELLEDALAGREADVAELAEERAQVMLAAQGKTAPPAVLAAHAAILGDAAAAASEPAEPKAARAAFPLEDWMCGVDNCCRPKPCHVHIGWPNMVEAGTTPDWLKPAEWFVGKRSSYDAQCDIDEKDGKVVRIEVPWVDTTTRERGSVWVTPQQLEAWPQAEEHYRALLLDWAFMGKVPLPLTTARIADVAGKTPLAVNDEASDSEDDWRGGFRNRQRAPLHPV